MIDERDVLERALRRFVPEPGMTERVFLRRERKRRNQRIRAGVLGAAVALAVVLAGARSLIDGSIPMVPTPIPTSSAAARHVGFIGVPPEGAQPSTPVAGDLVLSLDTTVSSGDPYKTRMWVYADGRMIWERHAAATGVPEGALWNDTGYLEQVLTPEGVETLRSEIVDSGLFEEDLHLKGEWVRNGDIYGTRTLVLDDRGEMTSLAWGAGYPDERPPTAAEMDTIRSLVGRLRDPGAWLSDTAWDDARIRAFVASSYGVTFSLVTEPDGECRLQLDPSAMPAPADEILSRAFNQCFATDEASRLVEGLEGAGIVPDPDAGDVWYETGTGPGSDGMTQQMLLYPFLPDRSC